MHADCNAVYIKFLGFDGGHPEMPLAWLTLKIFEPRRDVAKNKCLSTIWSTEKIHVAWTYPAREPYKNVNFL